jgi:apolipoprotein N-acyltransferase
LKRTDWAKQAAIKGTLRANKQKTPYVKYGDYIGRISAFMSVFAILYLIAGVLMTKKKKK